MTYAKNLRERAGRVGVQMQAIIDTCRAQGDRGLTSQEREQFHAMEAEYTTLEDSIKAAEHAKSVTDYLGGTDRSRVGDPEITEYLQDSFRIRPKQKAERMKDPHFRAFSNFLRVGMSDLAADDKQVMQSRFVSGAALGIQNTTSTTTGSQGGYIVPQGFSDQLEEAKKWFGGIEGTVGKLTTETGNPLPWPTLNDTTNKGRMIGQNVQVTQTDPVFSNVTFNAYIGSSDLCLIPLALMQDAYFDLDGLIAEIQGTRLGRLYNYECTVGTGTNEPTGIVTATNTAGNLLTLGTGNTTAIAYSNLVDVEHLVDPAYRYNPASVWMFNDAVLKTLKKLVDGQSRPLWQPGISASFREGAGVTLSKPLILDHPYIINQDMATPAASAKTILFGDLSKFKVREVAGGTTVMRLVERYADYLQVGFIAWQRFDSNLVDAGTHPIALMIQSAS